MGSILFVDIDRPSAAEELTRGLAGLSNPAHLYEVQLPVALEQLGPARAEVEVLSPFIASRVDRDALDALPALRLIATRSTGVDHIELAAARERGVTVCNVPVYGDNTVAEHTFALILTLSRRLRETYERVRRNELDLADLEGFDLRGKTLGVVGTGRIGLRVIQIARGFSMRVLAFDPHEQPVIADVLGFEYRPLDELLGDAEIVTLHAPHTLATHHLIGARELSIMKPGALLINTSRGGLVDTHALLDALERGRLGGAGLDVLEHEALLLDEDQSRAGRHDVDKMRTSLLNHILLTRDNVVFTPHVAFNSREANQRIFSTTTENIRRFLEGRPQNVV
jgi:D-lactate dehydrogenase